MSVLHYVHNSSLPLKKFVAHCVDVIHTLSTPEQWCHIDTQQICSDVASYGLSPDQWHEVPNWFAGPAYLKATEDAWPPDQFHAPSEQLLELKMSCSVCVLLKL